MFAASIRSRVRFLLAAALLAPASALLTSTPTEAANPRSYVYVNDDAISHKVYGFRMDAQGALAPLPGSPVTCTDSGSNLTGNAATLAYSAKRKLLFAGGFGGISIFRVSPSGALTPVGPSAYGNARISGLALLDVGNNTFLYAVNYNDDRLQVFRLASDGYLTQLANLPVGNGPLGITAAGRTVAIFNALDGTVKSFHVEKTGQLTPAPGSAISIPQSANNHFVTLSPDGRFLHVPVCSSSKIYTFSVNPTSAALTVLGSPLSTTGDQCGGVITGPGGLFATTGYTTGNVSFYRTGTTGAPTPLGPTLAPPLGVGGLDGSALDPTGKFMVLASGSQDVVGSFRLNATNGTLTPADTVSVPLTDDRANGVTIVRFP